MVNHNPYDDGKNDSTQPASTGRQPASDRKRYAAPNLVRYGTLAELTQQVSNVTSGDVLGGSNAS